MAYEKQQWIDGESPLNAERMNHMEEGIGQLSEGINEIQTPERNVTETGAVVSIKAKAGTEINVGADAIGEVTLYHCGVNMMPNGIKTEVKNGVSITRNADGTTTISGTPSSTVWQNVVEKTDPIYLPAGRYALRQFGFPQSDNPFALVFSIEPVGASTISGATGIVVKCTDVKPVEFVLSEGMWVFGYYTITTAYSGELATCGVTLCRHEHSLDYDKYVAPNVSKAQMQLPATLAAYDGVNMFYTTGGEVLTASGKALKGDYAFEGDVKESIAEAMRFDSEKYGLPVLTLEGDCTKMTKDVYVPLAFACKDKDGNLLKGIAEVKWQGSSSIAYDKKNYTIKFDHAFEAADGWGTQKKYCLKANYIDHSHARNIVSAKLWGQIVKSRATVPAELANLVNGGAVDGFPCIIVLNGEFHGLYTWNIPKDGWMLGMGSGENEAIVCAKGNSPGFAIEGFKQTVSGWGVGFELEYITTETDEKKAALMASLNNLINACINSDGSNLDTIGTMLDWDSAIDYYIFATMIAGHDMQTKNYLLYTYDGTKWYFGGYDMDSTYGLHWNGGSWVAAHYPARFDSLAEQHRLFWIIKNYKKAEVKARYEAIKAGAMSENNVYLMFSNFAGKIPSNVYLEDAKRWPMIPNTSVNNISQILNYYRMRLVGCDIWVESQHR